MTTDAIRDAAAEMGEAADIMGHVADYRQALMKLNGAPAQVQ